MPLLEARLLHARAREAVVGGAQRLVRVRVRVRASVRVRVRDSPNPNPNPEALALTLTRRVRHAGEPVVKGTRYVLVGFVRARPLAAAWREIGKEEEAPPGADEDLDEE